MTDDNDSTPTMWGIQHAVDRAVRGIAAAVAEAADAREIRQRRSVMERQLNALDDSTIADIGIAREQIPAIAAAWPDAPQLLRRMMERVGALPGLLCDAGLHREMEWNCVACSNRSQCRRWLNSPQPSDAYRSFCPNAGGLDGLAAARASG